jgi:hypothetical protein
MNICAHCEMSACDECGSYVYGPDHNFIYKTDEEKWDPDHKGVRLIWSCQKPDKRCPAEIQFGGLALNYLQTAYRTEKGVTTGMRIEIMLEEAKKCIKTLRSTTDVNYAPVVKGTGAGGGGVANSIPNAVINHLFLTKANNVTSVENCPFMVGERIRVIKDDGTDSKPLDAPITSIGMNTQLVRLSFATPVTTAVR